MPSIFRRAAVALAVPALVMSSLALTPAQAVDIGPEPNGTTAITPKPVTPEVPVDPAGTTLGAISAVDASGNQATLTAASGKYRITFLDADTFRVEATRTDFTDPANTPQGDPSRTANIVVGADEFDGATVTATDGATIVVAAAGGASVEIVKATGAMTAKNAAGDVIWTESAPITFGANSTTQHLAIDEDEQFLGGGMQNGRSIHTGATINIARNFDWDEDGYPNAVPYYMSSDGYGILRNTFARGTYNFADGTTTHEERRYDSYTFTGDYKEALDSYTLLTGRPLMPPVYALEYGDADCYNRGSDTYTAYKDPAKLRTPQALDFAKEFVEHDMPAGWMLVNDGYGCEYVELPETVDAIEEQTGLKTGLWTQRSLTNQAYEVGEAGIRLRKLDVAWVGQGYRYALTGCESAYNGIEEHSDARGTALMVEAWAGAQRCGMNWTGDHSGNLDAVRWQVSALTGSGNSGQPFTMGDVDGIFGGSTESYIRDLQWKAFAPALYSMSGWASVDKRPYLYGEEATDINRFYLQLRQQLMPYIYSLSENAHSNGTPVMRHMAIEFPADLGSYSAEANNQFLLGSDYLVAPVYTASTVRNGIYLPAGEQWVDYWTGRLYDGGQVLDGHPAPLDKLPVFVRAGAVVPQGIVARNASLVPEDSEVTVQVYPSGSESYTLYEDDKVTRDYKLGERSLQTFSVVAPDRGPGDVTVTIGTREGSYDGMATSRPYAVVAHTDSEPSGVNVDGSALTEAASAEALEAATTGWFYDATAGAVTVKVGQVAAGSSAVVTLTGTSAVGGENPDAQAARLKLEIPGRVFRGADTTITASFTNTGEDTKTDAEIALTLPEGWTLVSSDDIAGSVAPGETVTGTFVVRPGASAVAGTATIGGTASYVSGGETVSIDAGVQTELTYGSLADAFNHVSITTVEGAETGNFDGGGASFSAAALEAAGATPGDPITIGTGEDAITYTWPEPLNEPNAVSPSGQTISLSGRGTHLAVLGSAAAGSGATVEMTVTYTDGTTTSGAMTFPNWLQQGSNLYGSEVAITSLGRNSATNGYEYAEYPYKVYQNKVVLNPGKTLQSVTLNSESRVKLFAWTVVEQELPAPPADDTFASDWEWLSATNGYGSIGIDTVNLDPGQDPATAAPLTSNWVDPETGEKRVYEKGLGVHANGTITYYLGGECTRFTAEASMEDGFGGAVVFSVVGDGADLYQSRTFVAGFAPEEIDLDITGVDFLELRIRADSIAAAHGIWGNAKFHCGDAPVNQAPSVSDIADLTVVEGNEVNVVVSATDPDGDDLNYEANGLPAGLAISAAGVISGTATAVGVHDVTVTVTDEAGASAAASFTLTVTAAPVVDETGPVITPIADASGKVGTAVSIAVVARDESEPLAYTASGLPAGMTINAYTGVISGTPTAAGTFPVTVTVADAEGNESAASFTITVAAKPVDPVDPGDPGDRPEFVRTAPYTMPGLHTINGREWRTTCEPYSQTERCRTEIWASVVKRTGNTFTIERGWAFNNLTYLPFMTRDQWSHNPLGYFGLWVATDGSRWRTECDTALTGKDACRTFRMTTVYDAVKTADGSYRFTQENKWVFNNMVIFGNYSR